MPISRCCRKRRGVRVSISGRSTPSQSRSLTVPGPWEMSVLHESRSRFAGSHTGEVPERLSS